MYQFAIANTACESIEFFALGQVLSTIKRTRYDPKYVIKNFGSELEPDALAIISTLDLTSKLCKVAELEEKIGKLIKETPINSFEKYLQNFILKSPYWYDQETGLYFSGVNSVWENMLHSVDSAFPQVFLSLRNKFEYTQIAVDLISKYGKSSIKIHESIGRSKSDFSYTFHTLDRKELECIARDAYQIYMKIQIFLFKLGPEEKNFLALVELNEQAADKVYRSSGKYICASQIFANACKEYKDSYGFDAPTIVFTELFDN